MKNTLWEGRSSGLLYIYQYLFFVVLAVGLNYVGPLLAVFPLLGLVCFFLDAKTMKYQVVQDRVLM